MASIEPLSTLCVTVRISDKVLDAFKKQFSTVHYFPDDQAVPEEVWPEVDVWYARWTGLPEGIVSLDQVKKTKVLQLSSAGVNKVTVAPLFQSKEAKQQIKVCNSSGIHSLSIPQWIVAMIVNLYISTHLTVDYLRNEKKWASRTSIAEKQGIMGQPRYIYGKTIGFLGYGHIARETARVLKCMNAKIIAANSSGSKRLDEGYIIEGTGDKEGVLPEAYYSTNDAKSFNAFLSRCDILVASLPSTPQTQWMLKREHFDLLPKGAIFVNVGRGDLVKSETLIEALDAPNGLFGAALDVTDPEPLPENHALFTHPRAIVTPHVSGDFENYYDAGAELLLSSTEHYLKTGEWLNVVDLDKGY